MIHLLKKDAISKKELAELKASAENGGVDAQYVIGKLYYDGFNVIGAVREWNWTTALFWLKKAAEQGHSEAKKQIQDWKRDPNPYSWP